MGSCARIAPCLPRILPRILPRTAYRAPHGAANAHLRRPRTDTENHVSQGQDEVLPRCSLVFQVTVDPCA